MALVSAALRGGMVVFGEWMSGVFVAKQQTSLGRT
jgi:hypothetical protein